MTFATFAYAHEPAGPQGSIELDWTRRNISRVTSSGYGDSFGIEVAVKEGLPAIITIDGKQCLDGSYFLFDIDDEYAFDIDEPVTVEIVFDRSRSNGIWYSYDRNVIAEPLEQLEFGPAEGRWLTQTLTLERARFANRGEAGTDLAIAALSAMWPGIPGDDHRIVICDIKVDRSNETRYPAGYGEVLLRVRDENGKLTPARVGLYDQEGRMLLPSESALAIRNYDDRPRQIFLRSTHSAVTSWPHPNRRIFYVDGEYRAFLDPGKYRLLVSKGPEYRVFDAEVSIGRNEITEVNIGLPRWIDMPAAGWYSGDNHIHMTRGQEDNTEISKLLKAEDIHVSNLLQMGNPGATHFNQYAFGAAGRYADNEYVLVPGVEDPRTAVRGHTISLNIKEVFRPADRYLQYEQIFNAYRDQGGLSGYAHVAGRLFNVERGLALDVPLGVVDFIEIMQDGILDTGIWYDFLDLGFGLIPTAGSDFPYLGVPGAERNYVQVPEDFSPDQWYEQLRASHTFVTNGPILELRVNNAIMGSTLWLTNGEIVNISAAAALNPDLDRLDRLELVIGGEVVAVNRDVTANNSVRLSHIIHADSGVWIAVRAYGAEYSSAHSAATYVVVDDRGFRNEARYEELAEGMLLRLSQFDDLDVNVVEELEPWAVEEQLPEMFKAQRAHLLQSVDEAKRIYASMLDSQRR